MRLHSSAIYVLATLVAGWLGLIWMSAAAKPWLISDCAGWPTHDKNIYVGMSTALSGPLRATGESMLAGVSAYFEEVNRAGGMNGRPICLIVLDDGYDPATAAENTQILVNDPRILAIVGNVGTPTAKVSMPIAIAAKTLFFGALSGGDMLRTLPPNRYVINYRASYKEETAAMVQGLISIGVKPEEIVVFAQDDAYGDTGYRGIVQALKALGYRHAEHVVRVTYPRNTLSVENALVALLDNPTPPRAVIMAGAPRPSAKFIILGRQIFKAALYLNLSFVNGHALKKALMDKAEGVIITQVTPPETSNLPAVRDFRTALAAHNAALAPDDSSLEGYLVARLFVEGLRKAGPSPTRESIITALESLRGVDIGLGIPITFSPAEHQASKAIWPTIIRNGKFTPLKWESLTQHSWAEQQLLKVRPQSDAN